MVVATRTLSAWARYAWAAGILYVVALVAETVVGVLGGGLSQNGSAAKIANTLYGHHGRLLVVTYLSVVYAAMFLIYLSKLYDLLRRDTDRTRFLGVRASSRPHRVRAVPDLRPGEQCPHADAPERAPRHRRWNRVANYNFETRWCGDRDLGHRSQRTASVASSRLSHVFLSSRGCRPQDEPSLPEPLYSGRAMASARALPVSG